MSATGDHVRWATTTRTCLTLSFDLMIWISHFVCLSRILLLSAMKVHSSVLQNKIVKLTMRVQVKTLDANKSIDNLFKFDLIKKQPKLLVYY